MFVNVFKKHYAVPTSAVTAKAHHLGIVTVVDYHHVLDEYPSLLHLFADVFSRRRSSSIVILSVEDEHFDEFIRDWGSFLGLDHHAMELVYNHGIYCTDFNEETHELISNSNHTTRLPSVFDTYTPNKQINKTFDFFPAELSVYSALCGAEWAAQKFEYFRMYHAYVIARSLQAKLFWKGQTDSYLDSVVSNNDQHIKEVWSNGAARTRLLQYLESKDISTTFAELPIKEYIETYSDLGYNPMELWKFNWNLARYVVNSKFRLDVK